MNEQTMTTARGPRARADRGGDADLTFCTACGGSMRMTVRGAELWVECERLGSKRGLWLAISTGFHDRRLVEMPEGVLAAA